MVLTLLERVVRLTKLVYVHCCCFSIYFPNLALTSMLASSIARLGFFLPPMPRLGIELTSVQLNLFLKDLNPGRFTD